MGIHENISKSECEKTMLQTVRIYHSLGPSVMDLFSASQSLAGLH